MKKTDVLRMIATAIAETYRLGGRTLVAAPLIVAIAVIPEFAQHVAEIGLGMFDSRAAFAALANDPTRWAFGYAKVAGLVLAILFTARFWALGSVRRALLVPPGALLRILLAIGVTMLAELPFEWLRGRGLAPAADIAALVVSALIQAGLLVWLIAALVEDRAVTLGTAFMRRWPTALVIALLLALAFVPAQALHMANHRLALGQPDAVVWALMIFDSVLVGLLAALAGSALLAGYRTGASWCGLSRAQPLEQNRDDDHQKDQSADADAYGAVHGASPSIVTRV